MLKSLIFFNAKGQSLEYVGFLRNPTNFFVATAFSGRGYPIVLCPYCGTVTTVTVPVLQPVAF